jgi:hypothetical protein
MGPGGLKMILCAMAGSVEGYRVDSCDDTDAVCAKIAP